MREDNEAVVVLCKCGEVHKTYGIRAEKVEDDHWRFTWAFPIKEASARREGYDKTHISGEIEFAEEYPGCPYCGQTGFVVCSCSHISCTVVKNGVFTCDWCGTQGILGDYTGQAIQAGIDF